MNFMMTAVTANFSPCEEAAGEKIHASPSSDWLTSTSSLIKRISLGPGWARKGAHFSCRKFPLKEMIAPRILGSSPRLARKLGPNSPGGNGISSDHSLAIVYAYQHHQLYHINSHHQMMSRLTGTLIRQY